MIITNDLQAHYLVKKISKQYELGKKENLIPTYLNNGIEIFSHQIYAACFALENPFVKGFILADEAGLGKTMEALLIVSQYTRQNRNVLIIVPSPTINDWLIDLIRKFDIRPYILDNEERIVSENYFISLEKFKGGVVLTTLTVYNSVDKSYYKQATDKLNNLFNSDKMKEYQELQNKKEIPALKREIEEQDEDEDDPEIELLEKLLAEKKARKKNKDYEM